MVGSCYSFRIEHLAAGFAGNARHVHDVEPCRKNLLAKGIRQEGVLLLYAESIEST